MCGILNEDIHAAFQAKKMHFSSCAMKPYEIPSFCNSGYIDLNGDGPMSLAARGGLAEASIKGQMGHAKTILFFV